MELYKVFWFGLACVVVGYGCGYIHAVYRGYLDSKYLFSVSRAQLVDWHKDLIICGLGNTRTARQIEKLLARHD